MDLTRWRRWQEGDDRRNGGGAHDKIQAPEHSGEDDRDGLKAKGYIRKVEAWRRVTRLSRGKQALMLYNSLSGRAWRDAEELPLTAPRREWSRDLPLLDQGQVHGQGSHEGGALRV